MKKQDKKQPEITMKDLLVNFFELFLKRKKWY